MRERSTGTSLSEVRRTLERDGRVDLTASARAEMVTFIAAGFLLLGCLVMLVVALAQGSSLASLPPGPALFLLVVLGFSGVVVCRSIARMAHRRQALTLEQKGIRIGGGNRVSWNAIRGFGQHHTKREGFVVVQIDTPTHERVRQSIAWPFRGRAFFQHSGTDTITRLPPVVGLSLDAQQELLSAAWQKYRDPVS
ncbi:hypothetical protein ACQCX2_03980 [Propionibacteriaceae bacterium Y1700]|uniref:hypothetical protein n=1 Tax=Microlunatus sp. Y1700 TaxID=3418487 RepID=UPI003DA6DB29